jgi:hypothetical protein
VPVPTEATPCLPVAQPCLRVPPCLSLPVAHQAPQLSKNQCEALSDSGKEPRFGIRVTGAGIQVLLQSSSSHMILGKSHTLLEP